MIELSVQTFLLKEVRVVHRVHIFFSSRLGKEIATLGINRSNKQKGTQKDPSLFKTMRNDGEVKSHRLEFQDLYLLSQILKSKQFSINQNDVDSNQSSYCCSVETLRK